MLLDNDPSLGVRGIQESQQARLFFLLYFCMTSLHALHMLVGFVLIGIIAYFAYQGLTRLITIPLLKTSVFTGIL